MNHLEQLAAEWLEYNHYYVRVGIPVGPRPPGGFSGELDVVGFHPKTLHLLHIECSLDSDSDAKRQEKFEKKFRVGRDFIKGVFEDPRVPDVPEQVALLQFASGKTRFYGGGRVVTVREFVHEIWDGLLGTPQSGAVSSNLPLLRTLQLAADARKGAPGERVIRPEKRPVPSQGPLGSTLATTAATCS